MTITPFYAALFGLLFVALSVRTLRLRGRLRIAVGDAGNVQMLRAMRVHANFAEYVPIGLLLIALAEMQHAPAAFLHLACASLLIGRVAHAVGVGRIDEDLRFRVFGMAATLGVIVLASAYLLIVHAFGRVF